MPGIIALEERASLDTRSELMKAKGRAKGVVNVCPYGCDLVHLDEHGYCRHLVGFTTDRKSYEPLVREMRLDPATGKQYFTGRRVIRQVMKQVDEVVDHDDETGKPIITKVGVPQRPAVLPGDRLIRVTISYRVYRDVNPDAARKRIEFTEMTQAERDGEIKKQFHIGEEVLEPAPPPEDFVTVK